MYKSIKGSSGEKENKGSEYENMEKQKQRHTGQWDDGTRSARQLEPREAEKKSSESLLWICVYVHQKK